MSRFIMIFSSPLSQPSLLIPTPNQTSRKYSPPSPLHSKRPPPITCAKVASPSPPSPAKASSLYEVLKVPMGATVNEIKVAYRKLARVFHPDVAAEDAPADEFIRIHLAYSTLSDPDKRADYDRRILFSDRTRPSGMPVPVYSHRKWETDQCW